MTTINTDRKGIDGRMARIGAESAGTRRNYRRDAVRDSVQRINATAVPGWSSMDIFNDDARTTKADVNLMLKHAVAHPEAGKRQ